jgi:hypothetical protein
MSKVRIKSMETVPFEYILAPHSGFQVHEVTTGTVPVLTVLGWITEGRSFKISM